MTGDGTCLRSGAVARRNQTIRLIKVTDGPTGQNEIVRQDPYQATYKLARLHFCYIIAPRDEEVEVGRDDDEDTQRVDSHDGIRYIGEFDVEPADTVDFRDVGATF